MPTVSPLYEHSIEVSLQSYEGKKKEIKDIQIRRKKKRLYLQMSWHIYRKP